MPEVHLVVGCALILFNLLAFAVGGIAWIRDQASVPFWYLLRVAQARVFLQALLGGLLVFTGHEPDGDLHYLYGLLPLVVSFLAEGARAGAAERELRDIDIEALPPRASRRSRWRSSAARWGSWPSAAASSSSSACAPPAPAAPSSPC